MDSYQISQLSYGLSFLLLFLHPGQRLWAEIRGLLHTLLRVVPKYLGKVGQMLGKGEGDLLNEDLN